MPGNLSARERELVMLVAQGRTDAQIAAQLYISILGTVRSHLDRIRDKTGCRRRADLTRLALASGLGPSPPPPACRSARAWATRTPGRPRARKRGTNWPLPRPPGQMREHGRQGRERPGPFRTPETIMPALPFPPPSPLRPSPRACAGSPRPWPRPAPACWPGSPPSRRPPPRSIPLPFGESATDHGARPGRVVQPVIRVIQRRHARLADRRRSRWPPPWSPPRPRCSLTAPGPATAPPAPPDARPRPQHQPGPDHRRSGPGWCLTAVSRPAPRAWCCGRDKRLL